MSAGPLVYDKKLKIRQRANNMFPKRKKVSQALELKYLCLRVKINYLMHSNFIDNWPNLRFKTENEMLRTSLIKSGIGLRKRIS